MRRKAAQFVFLEGDNLRRLAPSEDTGRVNIIEKVSGRVLIGAFNGLFFLEGDKLSRLASHEETGDVRAVKEIRGRVLIGAIEGFFHLVEEPLSGTKFKMDKPHEIPLNYKGLPLSWSLHHSCSGSWGFSQRLEILRGEETIMTIDKILRLEEPRMFKGELDAFTKSDEYTLKFFLSGVGEVDVLIAEESLFVGKRSPVQVFLHAIKVPASLLGIAYLLIFLGLSIGAHWNRRCFEILTDSFWDKFWFYLGFLMRYSRPIQLWLLEPYFQSVRRHTHTEVGSDDESPARENTEEYVPMPLTPTDGSAAWARIPLCFS